MTRRHEGLMPLTHDHHHALAHARRLRVAAGGNAAELLQQAQSFLAFFHEETLGHFREEEEIVFPLAIDDERASELLARVVVEHLRIHALVARLTTEVAEATVQGPTAMRLAEALEAHIRLEEREVFPLLEQVISDEALRKVALKPRSRASV